MTFKSATVSIAPFIPDVWILNENKDGSLVHYFLSSSWVCLAHAQENVTELTKIHFESAMWY